MSRVYVEGEKPDSAWLFALSAQGAEAYSEMGNYGGANFDLKLPKNKGVYTLAIEVYAPDEKRVETNFNSNNVAFLFASPSTVLARTRIPLVVGDVPFNQQAFLRSVLLGPGGDISFVGPDNLSNQKDPSLMHEVDVLIDGKAHSLWKGRDYISISNLPDSLVLDRDNIILRLRSSSKDGVLGCTYIAMREYEYGKNSSTGQSIYLGSLAAPTRQFASAIEGSCYK
jgi:hypothetical protein